MPNDTPCLAEAKYLLELSERLSLSMVDSDSRLSTWREDIRGLLDSPDLESLRGERILEQLSLQLRSEWLRYANHISSGYLKSPPSLQVVKMPSGALNSFPYDRWNEPVSLEKQVGIYHPAPAGWFTDHIMFGTGMACMTCLLMVLRTMFPSTVEKPLKVHGVGGYFEIMDLLSATHDSLVNVKIVKKHKELQSSIVTGASQIIYIEPVSSAFNLDVLDMDSLLEAWSQRPTNVPTIIIFDTTLTGNTFPIGEFLSRIGPHKPAVIVQFSSALKLDQEGLEFSNGGVMSIYSHLPENIKDIAYRLRRFRAVTGLGLSHEQIAALSYPGFLDRTITDRHCEAVFTNNAYMAPRLRTGDKLLFSAKSHPILKGGGVYPWSVAPFMYLRLRVGTTTEDVQLLKYIFVHEAKERGLTFQPGSSFGFRAHRCEMGGIRDEGYKTIRIAIGCRKGKGIDKTIELINEMGSMRTFERLRKKYPQFIEMANKAAAAQKARANYT